MSDKTAFSMALTVKESNKLHRQADAKGLTVSNFIRELTGLPATKRGRHTKAKVKKIVKKLPSKKPAKKKRVLKKAA
jgi:hypothetical protein